MAHNFVYCLCCCKCNLFKVHEVSAIVFVELEISCSRYFFIPFLLSWEGFASFIFHRRRVRQKLELLCLNMTSQTCRRREYDFEDENTSIKTATNIRHENVYMDRERTEHRGTEAQSTYTEVCVCVCVPLHYHTIKCWAVASKFSHTVLCIDQQRSADERFVFVIFSCISHFATCLLVISSIPLHSFSLIFELLLI